MVPSEHGAPKRRDTFRVGSWLVQPDLNRLCGPDSTVALEPRLMDLLVYLAARPGEVVSKDQLIDDVWKVEFITEWAVTRAIAKLRRSLGDEAGAPRYIETISKRGYRLIAAVQTAAAPLDAPTGEVAAPPRMVAAGSPFVVGQWVSGAHFYGRQAQLTEILDGPRDCLWVLGMRVSGKTSLLRQLELVARTEPERRLVPVFWDLQGAEEPADLDDSFSEALLEGRSGLSAAGVDPDLSDGGGPFTALGTLRRALAERGAKLLLLVDEAEELIGLGRRVPALLRKLRRALQARDGIRTVLAASPRLWALAEQAEDTSPFLHGFTPPVYLGPLAEDEAGALVQQVQLAADARPRLDLEAVDGVMARCGNHPYLLSLLCARLLTCGDLAAATAELEADPTLAHLFTVDLSLLAAQEAAFLVSLVDQVQDGPALESPHPTGAFQLERLGLVRRVDGRLAIGNHFLEQWLRRPPS